MKPQEKTVWGKDKVWLSPFCLQALRLKWILTDLKPVKGEILEIGCGGGGMAKAIKHYRPDLEVTGCDLNQKAINWAKKNAQGVKFVIGDAYQLPFKDQAFSAVVTFDFLEHLEEPKAVINEANRVLKKGGLFHNFIPLEGQLGTFYWLLNIFGWKGKKFVGHHQKFKFKQIKSMMENKGFIIKKVRFGYHWLFQLVDLTYFFCWRLLRKRPVEGKRLLNLEKIFSPFLNLESFLLQKVPAGGVCLGTIKR